MADTTGTSDADAGPIRGLNDELMSAWNAGDAERFAEVFWPDGDLVGFDGTHLRDAEATTLVVRPGVERAVLDAGPTHSAAGVDVDARDHAPGLTTRGPAVMVTYPRLTLRRNAKSRLTLDIRRPWAVRVAGSMSECELDFRHLSLTSLDVTGDTGRYTLLLPTPTAVTPVNLRSISKVTVSIPPGCAYVVTIERGARDLQVGDERIGAGAGPTVLSSPGAAVADARYEIRLRSASTASIVETAGEEARSC